MSFSRLFLAFSLLSPLFANAHNCSNEFMSEVQKIMPNANCRKKALGAEFGWVFNNKTRQLDIAFGSRIRSESGWLAWGLNPNGARMVGTEALIGIKLSNHSLERHYYNITFGTKRGCQLRPSANVVLGVTRFEFNYWEATEHFVIQATALLPEKYDCLRANVVWQMGEMVIADQPMMHGKSIDNFNSVETLNLVSGDIISFTAHKRRRMTLAHGILNIVGWGMFLPLGVIIARYFKIHPKRWKRWFNFHVSCQSAGYIIGSTGWALGIYLGETSRYYSFHTHRILGIIIFTFTSVQMLALILRPKFNDGHRIYWNMYHHFVGYSLLVLIFVNIFVGAQIMEANHVWKWAYIIVLGVLGMVTLLLEGFSWTKFLVQRGCFE